jgi:hypothetical protein
MPRSKDQDKRVKLDDKTIERGFGQVAEDISLLKNVIAKTVEEINRLKGFQYVMANILEECVTSVAGEFGVEVPQSVFGVLAALGLYGVRDAVGKK